MPVKKMTNGFALLEAMVAVFILAFGILGLASVQMKTYGVTRETEERSTIALHAEALAEAMRANPKRVIGTDNKMTWNLDHYKESSPFKGALSVPANDCKASACSQGQLAAYDLYQFHEGLKSVFPVAGSVIAQVCPTTNFVQEPTMNNLGCSGSGPLALKVVWQSKINKKDAVALGTSSFGFQLKVEP